MGFYIAKLQGIFLSEKNQGVIHKKKNITFNIKQT